MKAIGYLKGLSEGCAICSDNPSFEVPHQQDVAYFAQKLAFERKLDGSIALMIAYGHDLGRIKNGVTGSRHAKEGAKLTKEILKHFGVQNETIKVVSRAIKNHSHKEKIDDEYSELIKDADALAHRQERILCEDDVYELARIKAIVIGNISLEISEADLWFEALESLYIDFVETWTLNAFDAEPSKWVHATRVKIRKIRSLILLFSKSGMGDHYDKIDKKLKRAFKMLAEARMIHVMMLRQEALSDKHQQKSLESELNGKFEHIRKSMVKISFDKSMIDMPYAYDFEDVIAKTFRQYMNKVTKLDFEDVKGVHKTRVIGKSLKDWFDMGLIRVSTVELVDAVEMVHRYLGEFNDLNDILNLPHMGTYFDKSKVKKELAFKQEKSKASVFLFELMNRKTKDKATRDSSIILDEL